MPRSTPVLCPYPDCATTFNVASETVGRGVRCPQCNRVMTARPTELWGQLRHREHLLQQSRGGDAPAERKLNHGENAPLRQGSQKQRSRLYHQPETAIDSAPERYFEVGYEAGQLADAPRKPPNSNLAVVLDDLRSQWNVGSIFRTCEGLGWGQIHLCGITPMPPAKRVLRVALGAEDIVPWDYCASSLEALHRIQAEGFTPVALEVTADAVPLDEFIPPPRCALVIGNEVAGVSREVLAACENRVSIPMAGRKASLNAAVAFGIAAHHLRSLVKG